MNACSSRVPAASRWLRILLPILVLAVLLYGGDSSGSDRSPVRPADAPPSNLVPGRIVLRTLPPTPKDVLIALLSSSHIPLSVDPSCVTSGTGTEDRTIGEYISGFLAEISDPGAANAVVATARPAEAGGRAVWLCTVMVQHAKDEAVWRWGVQFYAGRDDGVVQQDSFRCLGAG